ncbi:MAG TPA: tRNA lysidine(34) synthetase TilS [Casimicrobiaceae bacterium]|nr:tRNA lysidine(34) synthetase TilS [Casimicrobiaceae bacterium]
MSGGRDSIALLDAALAAAQTGRVRVVAIHVHHGLSASADRWSAFCADTCAALGVEVAIRRVQVTPRPRASTEALAREARYAALADAARRCGAAAVLLAHHADDQAETLLLQLLRGAGPRGLAAMPPAQPDDGILWLRPLLALTRAEIDACVAELGLAFVEDESNAQPGHRRNALRLRVVPPLREIAAGYPQTLVRAARLQAEAALLADDLAQIDARGACDARSLDRAALAVLPARRARNLLRWFLRERGLPAPSAARLAEMLRQLCAPVASPTLRVSHAGLEVSLHRGRIVVHDPPLPPYARELHEDAIELPHGRLSFAAGRGEGIAKRHFADSRVSIRAGIPGERLLPAGRGQRRAVADLLREAGVPHWERRALPRVYCGDRLAAVATLGVDAAFAAGPGEPGMVPDWRPAIPGAAAGPQRPGAPVL